MYLRNFTPGHEELFPPPIFMAKQIARTRSIWKLMRREERKVAYLAFRWEVRSEYKAR
jgi:hypothetical protein